MDVLIIADFAGNFNETDNNRFVYLAQLLISNGFEVEIVTSTFNHQRRASFLPTVSSFRGIKITMLKESPYSKNVSMKRFFSHYFWGRRVGRYLSKRNKPDLVYCAIPTLKAACAAGHFCNKNKIPFFIDVQDLWPEAYRMVFNIPIISSILFSPFRKLANSAYKSADEIIAVSKTYANRALSVNKKINATHPVFLGTDLAMFDKWAMKEPYLKKQKNEIWLGYCGTLGTSYDLKVVFDALRILDDCHLKFVIMGNGPKIEEFKKYSEGLNVLFTGSLPYKDMCSILSACDIVVNPIIQSSSASIINKHADYAAAGKPVINTQKSIEYRQLIDEYKMGFNVNPSDSNELAKAILILIKNETLRLTMGQNSRKCAEAFFDRGHTYNEIVSLIRDATKQRSSNRLVIRNGK